MPGPWPVPNAERPGQVTLAGLDLMLVPGTYSWDEPERFAPQGSQGVLQYQDFNSYETPWDAISWHAGYGLRRYSDVPTRKAVISEVGQPTVDRRSMYLEASNVDCRFAGAAFLGPLVQVTPTNISTRVLWIGEFTPAAGTFAGVTKLVAVTTVGVWYMDDYARRSWTATTIAFTNTPLDGAIGVFGGNLIIGFGSTQPAQYTNDLVNLANVTNTTPTAIYVWSFGADRTGAYVAGGPATTDKYRVTSGTNGITNYSLTLTDCGNPDTAITSLLPGGSIFLLIVGKEDGLGALDSSGVFKMIVPFDSRIDTNCLGARWWLGTGDDQQRGPLSIFFPRDSSGLWAFQPSSQNSGTAKSVAPWSNDYIRPPNIRGRVTAIQGTPRFLYYTVQNSSGNVWLVAQGSRDQINHPIADLGEHGCRAITLTSLITGYPTLVFAYGATLTSIASIDLPADGESPIDNTNVFYATTGTLTLPEIDMDLPDEQKVHYSVRVVGENLSTGRTLRVEVMPDGSGTWQDLGVASVDGVTELTLSPGLSSKRLAIRVTFSTDYRGSTPILRGLILRGSVNPVMYRVWKFQATLPVGNTATRTDDLKNPLTTLQDLWRIRQGGLATSYYDRWGTSWVVRVVQMGEKEVLREPDETPLTLLDLQLLEVAAGMGDYVYDGVAMLYDVSTSLYSGTSGMYDFPDLVYDVAASRYA